MIVAPTDEKDELVSLHEALPDFIALRAFSPNVVAQNSQFENSPGKLVDEYLRRKVELYATFSCTQLP